MKLQRKKIENTRLKGEFAGLKMGPSGGSVFGAAVLEEGKINVAGFAGQFLGPPGGPKNGAADLYFFGLSKKKLWSDMGVGGSVDEDQLWRPVLGELGL